MKTNTQKMDGEWFFIPENIDTAAEDPMRLKDEQIKYYKAELEKSKAKNQKISEENIRLKSEKGEVERDNVNLQIDNVHLRKRNICLEDGIKDLIEQIKQKDIAHEARVTNLINQFNAERVQHNATIEAKNKELEKQIKAVECQVQKNERLAESNKELKKDKKDLRHDKEEQAIKINELQAKRDNLKQKVRQLKQDVNTKQSSKSIYDIGKEGISISFAEVNSLPRSEHFERFEEQLSIYSVAFGMLLSVSAVATPIPGTILGFGFGFCGPSVLNRIKHQYQCNYITKTLLQPLKPLSAKDPKGVFAAEKDTKPVVLYPNLPNIQYAMYFLLSQFIPAVNDVIICWRNDLNSVETKINEVGISQKQKNEIEIRKCKERLNILCGASNSFINETLTHFINTGSLCMINYQSKLVNGSKFMQAQQEEIDDLNVLMLKDLAGVKFKYQKELVLDMMFTALNIVREGYRSGEEQLDINSAKELCKMVYVESNKWCDGMAENDIKSRTLSIETRMVYNEHEKVKANHLR